MKTVRSTLLSLFFSLFCASTFAAAQEEKLMIQFGWNVPSTDFIVRELSTFQSTPFDGLVYEIAYDLPNATYPARFSNVAMSPKEVPWSSLSRSAADMSSVNLTRLKNNFVRVNISGMSQDWFDDLEPMIQNFRMLGRYLALTKTKGIFLDIETYSRELFDYRTLSNRGSKSFDEYSNRVRSIGRTLINAIKGEDSEFEIFLPFMYEQLGDPAISLAQKRYGLLPAFLDGIVGATDAQVNVHNGHQVGYSYRTAVDMDNGYNSMTICTGLFSRLAPAITNLIDKSFSLWIDKPTLTMPFSLINVDKNYFSPARLRTSSIEALRRSDKYLLLYSQNLRWWYEPNYSQKYFSALRDVRRAMGRAP